MVKFTTLAGDLPKSALRCLWDMVEPEDSSDGGSDSASVEAMYVSWCQASSPAHSSATPYLTHMLWHTHSRARGRIAMNLLAMVAAAKPAVLDNASALSVLRDRVFDGSSAARKDYRLMRHACVALQRLPPRT